ncbi:MAG: hypothetical protein JSV05_02095 [Candidatus Bathyarchaeota archaeon]|nr:MAG: hypothetical protein JSV05_02095 [Candidatus Bathyarchaeota archaeon]
MRSLSRILLVPDKEDAPQGVSEMVNKLTEFEKEVYDFIKGRGTILTSNMPLGMSGVIPNLKNKGVIEVFKERTSRWASKKRKFVRIKGSTNGS